MSANSKTGGAPIFYCPICPMLPGWLLVQARDAHMEDRHPEQPKVTGDGLTVRPIPERALATEAECVLLRAENAQLTKALEAALPWLAHTVDCARVRPIEEWSQHGSMDMSGCRCAIALVRAALAKARGEA